jgi:hypothetical protein
MRASSAHKYRTITYTVACARTRASVHVAACICWHERTCFPANWNGECKQPSATLGTQSTVGTYLEGAFESSARLLVHCVFAQHRGNLGCQQFVVCQATGHHRPPCLQVSKPAQGCATAHPLPPELPIRVAAPLHTPKTHSSCEDGNGSSYGSLPELALHMEDASHGAPAHKSPC